MNTFFKRVAVCAIFIILMSFGIIISYAHGAEIITSGECGTNLTWTLDDEGVLKISGNGRMRSWTSNVSPFSNNDNIKSVIIEDGVTTIGTCAFYGCTDLTKVSIGNDVTSIGSNAFAYCVDMEEVLIGKNVESIGMSAFERCAGLENINLPQNLKEIGQQAFHYCSGLKSIIIPDGVTTINAATFRECTHLSNVIIGDGVRIIKSQAFYICPNLSSVKIGKSVKSIGENAFGGCAVTSVYVDNLDIWCDIFFEEPSANLCGTLYIGNVPVTEIMIGKNINPIRNFTFEHCDNLQEVIILDGVTSIGEGAFSNCNNLEKIIIPSSVTSIGRQAFAYCKDLVISCVENSAAHVYAIENNIDFVLIDGDSGSGDIPVSPLPKTDTTLYIDNNNLIFDISSEKSLYGKVIIIAMYSDSGQLINLINVPQVHSISSAYVVIQNQNTAERFKIFLWNSMSSIEPDGVYEEVNISDGIVL